MAVMKNGALSGTVGRTVSYTLKGKQVVRSLPKKYKQTAGTRASSQDFANIKRLSRSLRSGLGGVFPASQSPAFMYVMDAAARRWYYEYYLRREQAEMDPAYFNNLHITPSSTAFVKTLLGIEPLVDWSQDKKVVLQIPAINKENMMIPSGVKALSLSLVVCGGPVTPISKVKPKSRYTADEYFEIGDALEIELGPTGTEAVEIAIDNFAMPGNSLWVAYLSVRYSYGNKTWIDEEKWKPVVVVGSSFKAG